MYLTFKNLKVGEVKNINKRLTAKRKVRMMSSRLKCNKIGAADAITRETAKREK